MSSDFFSENRNQMYKNKLPLEFISIKKYYTHYDGRYFSKYLKKN